MSPPAVGDKSVSRVGPCFDNAVAQAAFSTMKVEYVHRDVEILGVLGG